MFINCVIVIFWLWFVYFLIFLRWIYLRNHFLLPAQKLKSGPQKQSANICNES